MDTKNGGKRKMTKDSLGDRMKHNYENRSKTYLTRRTPVIIRLDGKAFHSFTRGFERPYDTVFHTAMNNTLQYLCENIQGCRLGYTQSDEITLLLTDYEKLTTDAWFDYSVQKMCSVAASMATMAFNRYFMDAVNVAYNEFTNGTTDIQSFYPSIEDFDRLFDTRFSRINTACFDARCFNVPKEEVANCFIWRQQDATRNAIQMLGQTHFSDKQLDGKSNSEVQDMLMLEKGINFNDMATEFKRGVCCCKIANPEESTTIGVLIRPQWVIDTEIPIFTQNRNYIERFV